MHSRRLSRVSAAAAAALALSACALESNESSGEGVTTLTFWSYYSGTQAEWLDRQIEEFEDDHPDVRIDVVETVGDQQAQRLLASVSTGTTPDLFINNIVVDYLTLVSGDVFADITDEWDGFEDKDVFGETAAWETDGKVYNLLPFTNLIGLFYNEDVLDAVGIDEIPTTLDELTEALEAVESHGEYSGIALSGAPTVEGAWIFAPQLLGLDIGYCNFSGPEVDEAFERIENWSRAGYLPQATATWDQTDAWQQFATGEYAFGINGNWNLGNAADTDFAWGTAPYPAPDGGQSIVYPGGEGFGIGSTSEHKELAWEFLEQAVLSQDAGESIYDLAGSIPVRTDMAEILDLDANPEVQPFVAAAQSAANWPENENTANLQTRLGEAVSSVYSGQSSAAEASENARTTIEEAIRDGGGTC